MNVSYSQPAPGHYRNTRSIHVTGELVICDYPLRIVRLNSITARLLSLCTEQRTCEELAQNLDLPIKRVEMLCEQLRWKGLLEAGRTLPPVTWPAVSIIIPSHNRAKQLERCLRSLFEIDYPVQYLEIIVADDASTLSPLEKVSISVTASSPLARRFSTCPRVWSITIIAQGYGHLCEFAANFDL